MISLPKPLDCEYLPQTGLIEFSQYFSVVFVVLWHCCVWYLALRMHEYKPLFYFWYNQGCSYRDLKNEIHYLDSLLYINQYILFENSKIPFYHHYHCYFNMLLYMTTTIMGGFIIILTTSLNLSFWSVIYCCFYFKELKDSILHDIWTF